MAVTTQQVAVMIGTLQIELLDLRNQILAKDAEIKALSDSLASVTNELLARVGNVTPPASFPKMCEHEPSEHDTGGHRGGGDAGVHAPHDDEAPS